MLFLVHVEIYTNAVPFSNCQLFLCKKQYFLCTHQSAFSLQLPLAPIASERHDALVLGGDHPIALSASPLVALLVRILSNFGEKPCSCPRNSPRPPIASSRSPRVSLLHNRKAIPLFPKLDPLSPPQQHCLLPLPKDARPAAPQGRDLSWGR